MKIMTKVIKCSECGQDLTGKIKVFDKGKVLCEEDNWRKGEEVPKRKQ